MGTRGSHSTQDVFARVRRCPSLPVASVTNALAPTDISAPEGARSRSMRPRSAHVSRGRRSMLPDSRGRDPLSPTSLRPDLGPRAPSHGHQPCLAVRRRVPPTAASEHVPDATPPADWEGFQ